MHTLHRNAVTQHLHMGPFFHKSNIYEHMQYQILFILIQSFDAGGKVFAKMFRDATIPLFSNRYLDLSSCQYFYHTKQNAMNWSTGFFSSVTTNDGELDQKYY